MAKNKEELEIKRVAATSEQIEAAKKSSMRGNDFLFNPGRTLEIKECEFTGHTVNGKVAKRAKAIISFKGIEDVMYIQSAVKFRYDLDDQIVELNGTFTKWLETFETVGDCVDRINEYLKGVEIIARIQSYTGYDKNGNSRPIQFNVWDFADDKVAKKAADGKFSKPKKTTTTAKNK